MHTCTCVFSKCVLPAPHCISAPPPPHRHRTACTPAPPPQHNRHRTATVSQKLLHHHHHNLFLFPPCFLFSLFSCFPFCPFSCFLAFLLNSFPFAHSRFLSDRSYCTSVLPLNFILVLTYVTECGPTECFHETAVEIILCARRSSHTKTTVVEFCEPQRPETISMQHCGQKRWRSHDKLPIQKRVLWSTVGPDSWYSPLEIHICWKVFREDRIVPPIRTEYLSLRWSSDLDPHGG